MTDTALANIQNVIVLMFENRSFNNLLGGMPGVNGVLNSNGTLKSGLYNTMNPLQEPGDNNPATTPTAIVPGVSPDPSQPPNYEKQWIPHDFNHDFGDGNTHDLFGPGTKGIIGGKPVGNPITYPATNAGFLSTPEPTSTDPTQTNGSGVMTYFTWDSMKVFHTLAKSFVVCDAWHCDMPGHTSPNRAFMHCATTGDLGINDDDRVGGNNMVNRLTIFERIQQKGETWKMYWLGHNCDTNWLNEQVLSQQYDSSAPSAPNVTKVPISQFFKDLTGGTLPFYSFIMCWNDIGTDTSMHPDALVEGGENFLACIYNALRASSYWEKTLLIVNFDENGGMYDHVSVLPAVAPDFDPNNGQKPPVWTWTSAITNATYSFDFTMLGARTPVLLISPWLQSGVCFTQYQNTSILLQDMLPNDTGHPYRLTWRDYFAPSIAPVFDYAQFGVSAARTDCPSNIQGYADSTMYPCTITCASIINDTPPTAAQLAAVPPPHLVKLSRQYLGPLPGHPDSEKPLTRSFATVGEMRAYSEERLDAALAYIRQKKIN